MKTLLMGISYIGLGLTIIPSTLVLTRTIEIEDHFLFMIVGMVMWFATAPFWIKGKSLDDTEE